MKTLLLVISVFLLQLYAMGQCDKIKYNHWFFGEQGAGIDFSSDTAVMINSLTNNNTTWEGSTLMCDSTGDLLFYSDGVFVWNRLHQSMPNATNGVNLFANSSTSQSAATAPYPGNPNKYYIFTNDEGPGPMYYSIIDMSLEGGLGNVTSTKNVLLLDSTSEKLHIVQHCNQKDYWVLTHDASSNNFRTFLIDSNGLNTTPVISSIGPVFSWNDSIGTNGVFGYMKASPNGKKIALAMSYVELPAFVVNSTSIDLFDFNNATGEVSNFKPLPIASGGLLPYGISFSPDNSKLYYSLWGGGIGQFDVSSDNLADIIYSSYIVDSGSTSYYGAIQCGPNNKIFVADMLSPQMGIINTPNASGNSCNWDPLGLNLLAGVSSSGLPNIIEGFVGESSFEITGPDTICQSELGITYHATNSCSSDYSINWECLGSSSILASYADSVIVEFANTGTDTLIASYTNSCSGFFTDTIFITLEGAPPINLGNDSTICNSSQITLNAGSGFSSYEWQDTSSSQTYSVNSTGEYWVVGTLGKCFSSDTILLVYENSTPMLNLGNDTLICEGDILVLIPETNAFEYVWQDGSTDPSFLANDSGYYWVTYQSPCGGIYFDSIEVDYPPYIDLLIGDTTICIGEEFLLETSTFYSQYLWQNNSVNPSIVVSEPGIYSLTVLDSLGCSFIDSVFIYTKTCEIQASIPNVFTPNGDGKNDRFFPTFEGSVSVEGKIFNRWGQILYDWNGIKAYWDGNMQPVGVPAADGVYYYSITATDAVNKEHKYSGFIHLMR